ncbi:MAG: YbbR-like protein [Syntrophaceae bacterium PtaU1.Bin231]|nr:MAG: YbbR-like protein [Syntrophaceae bacterium PtaU1.Bin231]
MKSRKFIDAIIDKWPAKVLSVVIAMLLFMFNRMSALEERFFSVPLSVAIDGDFVPASSYPRMVRVTLRGEANSIYPILEDDIEAYIDLTRYKTEGVYKAPVLIRKKGTALGVDPLEAQVDPLEVAVAIEKRLTKFVPVTPTFRGYLESGYELSSYTVSPPQIEVSGPAGLVENLKDLTTDFIELSGKKENFSVSVKVINRDGLLSIRGNGMVEFGGTIQQSIMIRTLERLPIVLSGLKDGLIARPKANFGSVRLQGSQNDLEAYVPEASLLSLDCSSVDGEGLYILPLIVSSPPNFTVVRFDPIEIEVEIDSADDQFAPEAPR